MNTHFYGHEGLALGPQFSSNPQQQAPKINENEDRQFLQQHFKIDEQKSSIHSRVGPNYRIRSSLNDSPDIETED